MVEVRLMTPVDAETIGRQQLKQPVRLRVLTCEELVSPHAVQEEAVETDLLELSFNTIEEAQEGSEQVPSHPEEPEEEEGEGQDVWPATRDQDHEANPWSQALEEAPPSSSEDDEAETQSGNNGVELLVPSEGDDTQGQLDMMMVQPVRPPRPTQSKTTSSSALKAISGFPRNKSSNTSILSMVGIAYFKNPLCLPFFVWFSGHTATDHQRGRCEK